MRTKRSLLNYGTTILFFVVTTLLAIVTTPLLIAWLGSPRWGAFRVIVGWYGYLTLLELGLGGAISPMVAKSLGTDDTRSLHQTLAAGLRAYARVSVLTIVVGLLVVPWVPLAVKDITSSVASELRTAWIILLAGFIPLCLLPFRALQDAAQLGYRNNLLQIAQSLLITFLSVMTAWLGFGIPGQAFALAVGAWIFPLTLTMDALRGRPGLLGILLRTSPDSETREALRKLSLPTLLYNIASRISLMTDDIVVGRVLGDFWVTNLFVSQRLAVLAQSQIQSIGSATWAALAQLHAQNDREGFNKRLLELTRLVSVLAVATLGPIAIYNRDFVALWMKSKFTPFSGMDQVILVASINAWLLGLISLWGWCLSGTGRISLLRTPAIISAIINLTASLLFTYLIGVVGVLLGTTLALIAVYTWYLPYQLQRTFGVQQSSLYRAALVPVVWGVGYALILGWLIQGQPAPGWISLAAQMGVALVVFLILSAFFLISSEDRRRWQARIQAFRRPTVQANDLA